MKKTIIFSLIILASLGTAFSQTFLTFSYEPATPMGDMTNFISRFSPRGFGASGDMFVTEKITVGFTAQWTGFFEEDKREMRDFESGAVTANAWKEFYIWNLYANAQYHFLEDGAVLPFIGLSVGTAYTDQKVKLGTYDVDQSVWRFALSPHAGVHIPMGREHSWGFNVMARYQMNFYNQYDISMLQYINYSFGIYWKIYKRGQQYEFQY